MRSKFGNSEPATITPGTSSTPSTAAVSTPRATPSAPASAAWTAESDQASARFGISVATAGDVNGDGYSDVIVGASHYDNGETNEGRAYVYHGSAAGLATSAAWTSGWRSAIVA